MPNVTVPVVKFDTNAEGFICPKCKARFAVHSEFVTHFSTEHAPDIGVRRHGPVFTAAATPQAAGGEQVTCPVCNRRLPGSDYEQHSKIHAGGGITFNQEQPR